MANPFAKTRPIDQPYAVYEGGTMTWRILKTYKLAKNETGDPYARWLVAAKSDAPRLQSTTFGSFDMGDTYAREVRNYGRLVAAEPDWLDAYGGAWDRQRGLPTPAEYLELESNA